ncbi:hypothetical protein IWZ03DRAFT_418008 [Phyllosticta citriasiana]|uniref:Zn(2)-C6 fungal-type domain-containing protein n=1 Tax=Phyllosticta citriasiana TaxID=595635 RepID=A0ABR1KBL0_9PEZI
MSDKPPSPPPRARTHLQQKEKFDRFPEQHEHPRPQGPASEDPGNRLSGRLEPRQVELQPRRIHQSQREPTATNTSDPPQDPRNLAIQERLPTASMLAEPRAPQMGPFDYQSLARTAGFGSGYGGPTLASVPQDAAFAGQIPLRNQKTARRNKAHVASACVNCKRAHLSCDVQRPCMRCVASGKEVRVPDDAVSFIANVATHRRPLASTFNTRNEDDHGFETYTAVPVNMSWKPLLQRVSNRPSQGSCLPTGSRFSGTRPAPSPLSERRVAQYPAPPSPRPYMVTPIALLNLDLRIIKTNPAFDNLFGRRDMQDFELADLIEANPLDMFQRLRSELREERDRVEPAYLAPIFAPQEHEMLQSVEDDDLERLSRPYSNRIFTCRFKALFIGPRDIQVNIRLAKSTIYFVSLTLPPYPPQSPQSQTPEHRPTPLLATPNHSLVSAHHHTPQGAAARTPTSSEYPFPTSYETRDLQASPLATVSQPSSPYSSYFSFQAMSSSLPAPSMPTPAPSHPSFTQQHQSSSSSATAPRFRPSSWSSSGSAPEQYQITGGSGGGGTLPSLRSAYEGSARPHRDPYHYSEPRYFSGSGGGGGGGGQVQMHAQPSSALPSPSFYGRSSSSTAAAAGHQHHTAGSLSHHHYQQQQQQQQQSHVHGGGAESSHGPTPPASLYRASSYFARHDAGTAATSGGMSIGSASRDVLLEPLPSNSGRVTPGGRTRDQGVQTPILTKMIQL